MGKRKFLHPEEGEKVIDQAPEEKKTKNVEVFDKPIRSFDVKHFRKELSSKQGQTIALTQFLQVCTNPDSEEDYLKNYLKAGGNCHEILRQINADNKKNLTLAAPTLHIFHLIIMKVQSSMPLMISITEEACRYFINTFMSLAELMLGDQAGPKHKVIVLKLFTSMVTLNPDLGVELLSQPALSFKNLQQIIDKTSKDKDSVRTTFINFVTSFLIDGHLPLVKAFMEKQGLLSLVLPSLSQDEGEAVIMFLNALKKNVIDSILISKSLKMRTFNHLNLNALFKLYYWRGPMGTKPTYKNEYKMLIFNLIDEILLVLFTSSKHGLYFIDKSLGTSEQHKNQNLYKAILTLKRPWENDRQQKLLLDIVKASPDLHRALITIVEQNFEPQEVQNWFNTVDFTMKIVKAMSVTNMLGKMNTLTQNQIVNFIRFVTLPVPILKHLHANVSVDKVNIANVCIKLLIEMLSSLNEYLSIFKSRNKMVVDLLKLKLEMFSMKHFPKPDCVLKILHNVIGTENENTDVTTIAINMIDVLILYNNFYPSLIESIEGSLNVKQILENSRKIEDNCLLLKFKVLSLYLMIDSTALAPDKELFKEFYSILLEMYILSNDGEVSIQAETLLRNFLKELKIFEDKANEIDILLHSLKVSNVTSVDLFVELTEIAHKNNEKYLHDIRQAKALLDNNQIDNVTDLFDRLETDECCESLAMRTTAEPTSFLIASQNYSGKKKYLKKFIYNYTINIFHYINDPIVILKFTENCKSAPKEYFESWMQQLSQIPEINDETLKKLSDYILNGKILDLNSIFNFLEKTDIEENTIVIDNQNYLITSYVSDANLSVYTNLLIFYLVQLTKLETLENEIADRIHLCLELLMRVACNRNNNEFIEIIMRKLFANDTILQLFTPTRSKKSACNNMSIVLVNLLEIACKLLNYTPNAMLKPFKEKLNASIKKALNKIAKKKIATNDKILLEIISKLSLQGEDIAEIFDFCHNLEPSLHITESNELSLSLSLIILFLNRLGNTCNAEMFVRAFNIYCNILKHNKNQANITEFEDSLANYLNYNNECFSKITKDKYEIIFLCNIIRYSTSKLAALILQHNEQLLEVFIQQMNKPEILKQREIVFPLGNAAIRHKTFIMDNQGILKAIYSEYKTNLMKALEKPHKTGQILITNSQLFELLILECMELNECERYFTKVHKYDGVFLYHVKLLNKIILKFSMCDRKNQSDKYGNYLLTILNLLSTTLKDESVNLDITTELTIQLMTNIEILKENFSGNTFSKVTETAVWQNLCKSILMYTLKLCNPIEISSKLIHLFTNLIQLLYVDSHSDITLLFDMVTSHSEFLNIILGNHEIKLGLVELLCLLIRKDSSVIKVQQIPLFLSAYRATQSKCDKILLSILSYYEEKGLPVNNYKPYLWGESAANYYSVRKSRSSALWNQPSTSQILNLFDKDLLENTVKYFPVHETMSYSCTIPQPLIDGSVKSILNNLYLRSKGRDIWANYRSGDKCSSIKDALDKLKNINFNTLSHHSEDNNCTERYDPRFVLPLLSHVLSPGSVVSCFKIIRMGLLSLPLMALSSYCPLMRAAGYHVLHRFYQQLETERKHKNDKLLLNDFFETLKQSLSTAILANENTNGLSQFKNPRLPTISATYLARSLMLITAPFDPLYKPLNNFLIAKHQIDFTLVPDFLSLFHDSDIESLDRRLWILAIMRDAVKTLCDVNVIFKTMSIKILLDFYSSVLADKKTKVAILEVISSLITVPRGAEILIEAYGIIPWIGTSIKRLKNDDKTISITFIRLIDNLYESLIQNSFMKVLHSDKKAIDLLIYDDFRINKDLEQSILFMVADLIHFSGCFNLDDLLVILRLLNKLTKKNVHLISKQQVIFFLNACGELLCMHTANVGANILYSLMVKTVNNNTKNTLLIDFDFYKASFEGDDSSMRVDVLKCLWYFVKFYVD